MTAHYLDDTYVFVADRLEGGYGGLLLQYYWMAEQVVHLSLSSIIGAGGMAILEGRRSDFHGDTIDETAFFVAEPGVGIGLNVTTFFRIGLEASYRFVVGSHLIGFSDADLSDPAVALSLHFGRF